jgi:hypothetical protein
MYQKIFDKIVRYVYESSVVYTNFYVRKQLFSLKYKKPSENRQLFNLYEIDNDYISSWMIVSTGFFFESGIFRITPNSVSLNLTMD